MLRYYALLSLAAVLVTATLLTWYYRQVAVGGITELGEHSNLALARAALSPIKASVLQYLENTEGGLSDGGIPALPADVLESIGTMMEDKAIVRIKIYNRHGVVVYSTQPSHIGNSQRGNPGVVSALGGSVSSILVYHDSFNQFDGEKEGANLIQTYIPIQPSRAEPAHGVFELYTDVRELVHQTERTEFAVMAGAFVIMAFLYALLFIIVRHAGRFIEQQQRTIRERSETLQLLSAQMLKSEELYKKNLATELQEDLAQSLAAIKLHMENGKHRESGELAAGSAAALVPRLQEAIHKTRNIAAGLRPSSLDDFGVLPTLDGLFREFSHANPAIRFERQIDLHEHDIPAALKVILYRIVVSVLEDIAQRAGTRLIRFGLWTQDQTLGLVIADTESEAMAEAAAAAGGSDPQARPGFARMEALVTLSGGEFSASQDVAGGMVLRAAWGV